MKIGVISDTHGFLDESIFSYFDSCDEIWHAGDIGSVEIIQSLKAFRPLRAVFGNIDDGTLRQLLPEDQFFLLEGKKILITHIAGTPPQYNSRIKKLIREQSPDILVCGHSHILKVMNDAAYDLLFINPGAAGRHGFHHIRTILRFELQSGKVSNMEVIELGKRGAL